jgi:hypothetical protein
MDFQLVLVIIYVKYINQFNNPERRSPSNIILGFYKNLFKDKIIVLI